MQIPIFKYNKIRIPPNSEIIIFDSKSTELFGNDFRTLV